MKTTEKMLTTTEKYFALMNELALLEAFNSKKLSKKHNVSNTAIRMMRQQGIVEKTDVHGLYTWSGGLPTLELADQIRNLVNQYVGGSNKKTKSRIHAGRMRSQKPSNLKPEEASKPEQLGIFDKKEVVRGLKDVAERMKSSLEPGGTIQTSKTIADFGTKEMITELERRGFKVSLHYES